MFPYSQAGIKHFFSVIFCLVFGITKDSLHGIQVFYSFFYQKCRKLGTIIHRGSKKGWNTEFLFFHKPVDYSSCAKFAVCLMVGYRTCCKDWPFFFYRFWRSFIRYEERIFHSSGKSRHLFGFTVYKTFVGTRSGHEAWFTVYRRWKLWRIHSVLDPYS